MIRDICKRFLIVDNIKQSRDTLKQFAYTLGDVKVDTSAFAKDAISACENINYDVVLLGYDLGENQKNGQQILEELKTKNIAQRQTIIIIITAEAPSVSGVAFAAVTEPYFLSNTGRSFQPLPPYRHRSRRDLPPLPHTE